MTSPRAPDPPGSPRILLVRTSALGDVVHALPVLAAVRRAHAAARIAWVVEERIAPLLEGHPDIDTLIVSRLRAAARHPWRRESRAESWRLVRSLRAFRPDLALDLMGNHRAGAIAWLSGARRRVGLERRHRREPSSALWINEPVPARGEHAVERAMSVLAALGCGDAAVDFAPDRLLPGVAARPLEGGANGDGAVLVHPGAAWGNKLYPASRWGAVLRALAASRPDLRYGVLAGPGEETLAGQVVAAAGGAAIAAPAPSLAVLTARLRASRLVLGSDTGPVHLAHALGIPVVMLHGPTDPRRHGPWRAPERALWQALPCSFCHRRFPTPKACLAALPPAVVARRALEALC